MATGSTYSFIDVSASMVGPGISTSLASEAAAAEEGISISLANPKNNLTTGASGDWMHSLHAANNGGVTVRLLKTSPVNAKLMIAYNAQRISSSLWGKNTITVTQNVSGDKVVCNGIAFRQAPDLEYATDGGTVTWTFDVGEIIEYLGTY